MPLRSSQRVPRGATQLRSTADRAQTTVAQRKSRRIARKAGEPGPSGWKHVEDGDERDLVPPSDVEEYEAWKRDRAGARQMDDLSSSPLERSSTAHGSAQPSQEAQPSHLSFSRPVSRSTSYSLGSAPTSPTVPIGSSQLREGTSSTDASDFGSESGLGSFDADDEDDSWPQLVASEGSIGRRSPRGLSPGLVVRVVEESRSEGHSEGSEVLPDEYEPPPADIAVKSPLPYYPGESHIQIPANSVANGSHWESETHTVSVMVENRDSPPSDFLGARVDQGRIVPGYPDTSSADENHQRSQRTGESVPEALVPGPSAVKLEFAQTVSPVRLVDEILLPTVPPTTPQRLVVKDGHSPRNGTRQDRSRSSTTPSARSAVGSQISLTPKAYNPSQRQSPIGMKMNGLAQTTAKSAFFASPSPFLSQNRISSEDEQSNTPLVEAQVGPHNQPEWSTASRFRSGTPTNGRAYDVNDIDTDSTRVPSHQASDPLPALASATRNHTPAHSLPPDSPLSPVPADPALERFRTARTFRTRTVLQLQPYTKEKQIYDAALRKGGLKKGKHAIAREREISPSEEDNEPEGENEESSPAEDVESERIVIGNTPPSGVIVQRKRKKLVDADYDEYFLKYGLSAQDGDAECEDRLQAIARQRLKAARLEKQRARQAEKSRKDFKRLIREGLRADRGHSGDSETSPTVSPTRSSTALLPNKRAVASASKPKTYAKRDRLAPPAFNPKTKYAHEGSHAHSRLSAVRPTDRQPSSSGRSATRLETPDPATISPGGTPSHSNDDGRRGDYDDGADYDFDAGLGSGLADTPHTPSAATVTRNRRREDSFFIDDLRRSSPNRRRASVSSHSSSAASDASATILDRRQKIARRMMPAAMLQRLEREADEKAKQRERKKRDANQVRSPAKPGRAVVRRGDRHEEVSDLLDFLGSDADSMESVQRVDRLLTPEPNEREQIVISDESDGNSSSSQAHEDNAGAQTLARLYEGDFETIIAGNKPVRRREGVRQRTHGGRSTRPRRPTMGLATRGTVTPKGKPKTMYQGRLDSAVVAHSPSAQPRSARKRKHNVARRRHKRPAIRLDDETIYAHADFAFEDESEVASVTSQAKKPRHTPSKTKSSAAITDNVDAGVGKGRSWANFDKFSVDFGISPLPSGIYCNVQSYVGSGRLSRLVGYLLGKGTGEEVTEPTSAYGVELRDDMPPAAIASVVGVLFSAIRDMSLGYSNDTVSTPPDLSPLAFLGGYLSRRRDQVDGDLLSLRVSCSQAAAALSDSLDSLHEVNGGRKRPVREAILDVRIALVDLACRANPSTSSEDEDSVNACATALLRQLLSFGFDKSIRPLKKLIKGDADTPEVSGSITTTWIAVMHILDAWSEATGHISPTFSASLEKAIDAVFPIHETGPIASERIWFLVFGLCALSQFNVDGQVSIEFSPIPRWPLVKRAIGLIKISHSEEAEERAHIEQLRGRDRYIKSMIARCIRLSAVWKWNFERGNFSIATKDLGVIFKDRQHRNLPTEQPVDYPEFITHFDMTLTAAEDDRHESAFELYLRLVCVAASDVIASAQSLSEAQKAERDVQRLIMSIIPVSPVKFSRVLPPTQRQVGQLINRYSTMIAACYFSPSLLPWLLANSQKWLAFEAADFESRQVYTRGLMYLAVACRHHNQSLDRVVECLARILGTLQGELDNSGKPSMPIRAPSRLEVERTMVLVVACFRQIIQHHSFDPEAQADPVYPDPCLLHESWTSRIFALDLASDMKCGTEVVATIQAFLDVRAHALPRLAKQRREAKKQTLESQDEYSFGMDFTTIDLLALGGEAASIDPVQKQEEDFATIITSIISPRIYQLLSDMLPPIEDETLSEDHRAERQVFIGRLTRCWSDCVGVIVVEQNAIDGWTPYVGTFGKESWQRFRNEAGRLHVGLEFMLSVATIDPGCYEEHREVFLTLLFASIVTDRLTVEHKFLSALLGMVNIFDDPLFSRVALMPRITDVFDRRRFVEDRPAMLEAIFSVIPPILRSSQTTPAVKSLVYRCVNLLVSAMVQNEKAIQSHRVIHKESYHAFAVETSRSLIHLAGPYISPSSVPGLKAFI